MGRVSVMERRNVFLVVYKQKLDSVGRRSVSLELGSISHLGGGERIDKAVRLHLAKPATAKTKIR